MLAAGNASLIPAYVPRGNRDGILAKKREME
jgi:hypothetical protein